jgi:hypothetical protein
MQYGLPVQRSLVAGRVAVDVLGLAAAYPHQAQGGVVDVAVEAADVTDRSAADSTKTIGHGLALALQALGQFGQGVAQAIDGGL